MTARTWQPISEAPRDGRFLLLFSPDALQPIMVGFFRLSFDGDLKKDGTWRDDGREPTHWMPLPFPPGASS